MSSAGDSPTFYRLALKNAVSSDPVRGAMLVVLSMATLTGLTACAKALSIAGVHPFSPWSEQRIIDTAGRVERFNRRFNRSGN